MKKAVLAAIASAMLLATQAMSAESQETGGFKFQVGLTYVSGMNKLADAIEDNNPSVSVETVIPVGLTLGARYELDNGLAFGVNVGPAVVAAGDASFFVIPVGAEVRYYFLRGKSFSPYVRGGVNVAFAGGDYIEGSNIGFTGAAGVEFARTGRFGWGFEAGYTSTEVDVTATFSGPERSIKPYEFNVSIFARF